MISDQPVILVVDDDAFNRDVLEQELEALGHACILAKDGEQALEQLRQGPIDIVLLDIMMPGLDGFGVLETVRTNPAWRDIPVIVISALHDLKSTARGIELGAVDYLPKPFEPAMLKARLDASWERRQWRNREQAYLRDIERERQRGDTLLEALLPAEAIAELKATGAVEPKALKNVAVLFLDIVDFSTVVRNSPPADLVNDLTEFTESAETMAGTHGLEKIKLVGDAIMLTGNLLVANDRPIEACIACAKKLCPVAKTIGSGWRLRGGMAFGAVVTGVVGRERYSFDLWGHTVNLAARLAALPGADVLHLDATAAENAGNLKTKALGAWDLKNMGPTTVYRIDLQR